VKKQTQNKRKDGDTPMATFKKKLCALLFGGTEKHLPYKAFSICFATLIVLNTLAVIIDTFEIAGAWREALQIFEDVSVVIFTVEYIARIYVSDLLRPHLSRAGARLKYVFSFMAVIDLLAVLPFYIPVFIPVDLRVLRVIRLVRLLRIIKINRFTNALNSVMSVLRKKAPQILSTLLIILIMIVISSVLLYEVEHKAQPDKFNNIFSAFWWSVETVTTIGYGDIFPVTAVGKIINGLLARLGVGLVALPAGIIGAGFAEHGAEQRASGKSRPAVHKAPAYCSYCGKKWPPLSSGEFGYCPYCGNKLPKYEGK